MFILSFLCLDKLLILYRILCKQTLIYQYTMSTYIAVDVAVPGYIKNLM